MSEKTEQLSNLTKSLIETIGEDPNREGLIKTVDQTTKRKPPLEFGGVLIEIGLIKTTQVLEIQCSKVLHRTCWK